MESLLGRVDQARRISSTNTKKGEIGNDNGEVEVLVERQQVTSSEEESEDSEKQPSVPKVNRSSKESVSINWSPRMALRHISSFRRKSREIQKTNTNGVRSNSFTITNSQENCSPSRNSLPRRKNRNCGNTDVNMVTICPTTPIKIATTSSSKSEKKDVINPPHISHNILSESPSISAEKAVQAMNPIDSPVTDKQTKSKEMSSSEPLGGSKLEKEKPTTQEIVKKDLKSTISSRRFSENPSKSLSRAGLSPVTLKKAFQFTRSASWTQRKHANASPPCLPKLSQADGPNFKKESTNIKARSDDSVTRLSSLIHPTSSDRKVEGGQSPKLDMKANKLSHVKCESLDTAEEEDEEECDLDTPTKSVAEDEDDIGEYKKWNAKKEHRAMLSQRSQELDSPSNAALPILETPSVRGCEAAWVLRTLILIRAPNLLQDRKSGGIEATRCGIGSELTEWLMSQSSSIHSRAQAAAMWQVLLEEGALLHVTSEQPFRDKHLFYRFLEDNCAQVGDPPQPPLSQEKKDAEERLPSIVAFLAQRAPDATLRLVLRKSAATIVLREDNCQFLRVDKGDFNRILRDVEANTVRLKEHGKDVLVLEKISASQPHSHYKYTVMAGTPQKMLEHLLETRLDGRRLGRSDTLSMGVGVAVGIGAAMGASMGVGETHDSHLTIRRCDFSSSDFFLDDFLLTHVVFMPYPILTSELLKNYRVSGSSSSQDDTYIIACKRRVIHFTHRWVMTISDPIFANKIGANYLRELKTLVDADLERFGAVLREEASLMISVAESLDRYEQEVSTAGISKWKLPTSGRPISLFGASSIDDGEETHRKIHAHDDIIFRVYCADHTYCTLRFPLNASGETVKRSAADKLGLSLDNLLLVELKSNGDVVAIDNKEVCIPTGITINGRLFVAHKDHLDALTPLSDQDGPGEGTFTQLEMFSTKELAYHITSHDWDLFITIHEYEFLYQTFGRIYFEEVMCNLDVFRRRFNELQFWVATEICLANNISKRAQLLRKFIKLAAYCKEQQNLNAFFAIVIGLSNVAVSRLNQTWERLSSRFRKMFIEFEILIDPSRNHRAYRLYVAKLHPPIIPFTPLLMKDMTFTHEGNKTKIEDLINFEKMHMLAQTLRTIRYCRSKHIALDPPAVPKNEAEIRLYVRNLHTIDNQRRLLTLSQRHEPKRP